MDDDTAQNEAFPYQNSKLVSILKSIKKVYFNYTF